MTRDMTFERVIEKEHSLSWNCCQYARLSIKSYANIFAVRHANEVCHLFYIDLPRILTNPYIPLLKLLSCGLPFIFNI